MQVDNNDSPNYSTSGAKMELWEFDGGDYQKWNFTWISGEYYKITSDKSGLALSVRAGYLNTGEQYLAQEDYGEYDRQLWKITKTARGTFVIRPKSGEAYTTDWCMASGNPLLGIVNGVNVEQRAYSNDSDYKDEWVLCDYDYSILLAIDDADGASRDTYFNSTKNNLQTERNGIVSIVSTSVYTSCTASEMISYLQNNNMFIVHTHGIKTGFKIAPSTYLSISDLTGVNLSNLNFVLLLTCNTGVDFDPVHISSNSPVNIVEKMVCCGAKTVVGFKEETWVSDCNKFAPDLTEKIIIDGFGVEDAIIDISYTFYTKNMANIAVIGGDTNNTIR